MKLLMIHAWNEDELSYRGKFSGMLSYPSMTLAVLYSLVPKFAVLTPYPGTRLYSDLDR